MYAKPGPLDFDKDSGEEEAEGEQADTGADYVGSSAMHRGIVRSVVTDSGLQTGNVDSKPISLANTGPSGQWNNEVSQ